MAALNFPSSPTIGQTYSANDKIFEWNGTSWITLPSILGSSLVTKDTSGNVTLQKASRGVIASDSDLSFDLNASSNFTCTPTGTGSLTFTNISSGSGQSGYILLNNSGGYSITAAGTTKVNTAFLSTVSTAGVYLLSYFSNGTNVYVTTAGAMA